MNDEVIIKVKFEADVDSFNKQIDELEDKMENADLGTDNVTELLNEQRKLTTEINEFADGLDNVSKNSSVYDKLMKKMEDLGKKAAELRQKWAESSEDAADLKEIMNATQGLIKYASVGLAVAAGVKSAIDGIKKSLEILEKVGKVTGNALVSGFKLVGNSLVSITGYIANNVKTKITNIANSIKSLINIDIRALGTQAINTANDFRNLGTTGEVVARNLSNSFYDMAGSSYNSLVAVSNGTQKVTNTLKQFINTWTGQVALMKAQLNAIGTNIGNLLIKVFYPLLVVLNKILAVVNLLLSKLAALFGFNTASLKNLLGSGIGGDTQNKGLENYEKSAKKAAKATKKLSDETKKAKENLQGYDKLNNTTTDNLDDLVDTLDDLGDLGGIADASAGLIDTDKLFDNLMSDLSLVPQWLRDWVDGLVDLIKNGEWYKVGSKIGELVNKGLYKLEKFLSDEGLRDKIRKFNGSLLDFANGLLDEVDWNVLGKDIALALNTITFAIDNLYTQAVQKGTLIKSGKAIKDTFMGFIKTFDAKQAGRAAVTAVRAIIDVLFAAIDTITSIEMDTLATKISDFVTGAFDRLFGMEEGDMASGAEKIGMGIVKIINLGLKTAGELFNAETAHSLAQMIVDMLNAAIENFDEDDFAKALSGIMTFIGTLLSDLAEKINSDEFVDNLIKGINESIANGSVTTLVAGISKFIGRLYDTIKETIKGVDKGGLLKAILDGIFVDGGAKDIIYDWALYVFAPMIGSAILKALGVYFGTKWLLNKAFTGAMSKALAKAGVGELGEEILGGASTASKLGGFLKVFGAIGGIIGSIASIISIYKDGINEINSSLGILSATIAGFSIGGIPGAIIGAFAMALIELDALGKQYPEKVAEIGEKIGDFIGKGIVWLHEQFERFKQWLAEIMESAGSKVGEKIVEIVTDFLKIQEMWENVKQWFNDGVANLSQKAEELKTNIKAKIDEIIENINTTFSNLVEDAINFGKDFVMGIVEGIGDGAKWVYDKVNELVDGIKERFSHGLDINSPSKVMRDLAIYVPEGIALGIEDGESDVTSAMDNLVDSIKFSDFYSEALQETDVFVSDVTDKLAGIEAPTLDPLQYQSKILSSPAAATRALSQSYADTAGQRTDGVLSGIYNRMINAGQASGRNVIVDVYLDKNNRLGQYVIDTMKGQVVMTGGV